MSDKKGAEMEYVLLKRDKVTKATPKNYLIGRRTVVSLLFT